MTGARCRALSPEAPGPGVALLPSRAGVGGPGRSALSLGPYRALMVAEERALAEPLTGSHGDRRGARMTCRPLGLGGQPCPGVARSEPRGHNLRCDCSPEWAALAAVSFPGVSARRLRADSDVALLFDVNVVKLCP